MHIARKPLFLSAVLGAAALLVAAAFQIASPATNDKVELAADTARLAPSANDALTLAFTALKSAPFPAGTQVKEHNITPATASTVLAFPSDVVVSPARCADLLGSAVGGVTNLTGRLHRGITTGNLRMDKMVAKAAKGVDLAKLHETALSCNGASVTVRSLGLTGVLAYAEYEVPSLVGAESLGIQQTVSFPGNDSKLAQTVADAGSSLQTFVTNGQELVYICTGGGGPSPSPSPSSPTTPPTSTSTASVNGMAAAVYQAL